MSRKKAFVATTSNRRAKGKTGSSARLVWSSISVALLAITGFSIAGCDSKRMVSGRLLNFGQPLTVSDKGLIRIGFAFANNPDGSFVAQVKPDGTFTIPGQRDEGIPPGKYRVTVEVLDPYGQKAFDLLKGEFGEDNSPIVVDFDGNNFIEIDVAKAKNRSSGYDLKKAKEDIDKEGRWR